jgi:hypothetical protein
MKRKIELDDNLKFFKKNKPIGFNQDWGHDLVRSALSYEGKLQHIQSNGYYVADTFLYTAANDFLLNFCDSIGEIPKSIKQEVSEKFSSLKDAMAIDIDTQEIVTIGDVNTNTQPFMNCWEFCFLVLKDTGLVSEKQLDELCYIIHKINKQSPTEEVVITLAQALYTSPLKNYRKFSKESLPSPGDFLLFKKNHMEIPYHCSICIDTEGGYIELSSEQCVRKNNLKNYDDDLEEDSEWDPEEDPEFAPGKLYYVPVREVRQNIQNFIHHHRNILALKEMEPKNSSAELLNDLEGTQYEYLVNNIEWVNSILRTFP